MQLSKVRIAIRITAAWVIICWLTSMGVQLGVGIQDILFVKADLGPDAKQVGMQWIVYGVVPDVLSCVCDLIVFALPLKSLWGLQMGDRKKNKRLVLVFSVGFMLVTKSNVFFFPFFLLTSETQRLLFLPGENPGLEATGLDQCSDPSRSIPA